MKHQIIIAAVICLIITGTSEAYVARAQKQHAGKTIAGNWKLLPVLASDTATGKIPFLDFDVAGSSFTGN